MDESKKNKTHLSEILILLFVILGILLITVEIWDNVARENASQNLSVVQLTPAVTGTPLPTLTDEQYKEIFGAGQ